MNENPDLQILEFADHVRKRPAMYIGNDGIVSLFSNLITDCISLCKTDEITFEVTIPAENDFMISLISEHDVLPFIEHFTLENNGPLLHFYPKVLRALSEKFEITKQDSKTEIHFSIDKIIIPVVNVDYLILSETMRHIALLNRKTEIIVIDKREKYLNQNYYHFPQGIFYLFDKAISNALGTPKFVLTFDGKINSYEYQIGLAYRTDWFPSPEIVSFANDVKTVDGGSLVDGILNGLSIACKQYVKENKLSNYKITYEKFMNGLIIVCAVRGEEFTYGGGWKDTLENEFVAKEAENMIAKLALDFFRPQKEIADAFLWRFDSTQFGSEMF